MRRMMVRAGIVLLGICLVWIMAARVNVPAEGYMQTNQMVVADADQIKRTGVTFIDCPWSSWTVGDTRYWITSDWWGYNTSMYSGPVDDPTRNIIYSKDRSELYLNNDDINGNPWIVSVYKISDTELLAFLHIEWVESDTIDPRYTIGTPKTNGQFVGGSGRMSLAYSDNNGETFHYLGEILAPYQDKSGYNIQGTPYIIKDGYFYIYFNEINTNVARAKVTDVVAAAKVGQVTAWNKYYEGAWQEPGMGGRVSGVGLSGICHTQAAYSTYDGKYYMVMTSMNWGGVDTYVKLWQSDDGVNWRFYQVIVEEPAWRYAANSGWQYASIVDYGNEQNATVGQKFYVYCGNKTSDVNNMKMVRWTIDLADAPMKSTPTSVWRFDGDFTDDHTDVAGSGNAVTFTQGMLGEATRLLGLNNYVSISNHHTMNQLKQITLSTWIRVSAFPVQNTAPVAKDWSFRFIVHKEGNGHFIVGTENDGWYGAGTTAAFGGPLILGEWTHLAGTYDGEYVRVYVNGELNGTGANPVSGKVASSVHPLRFGYGSGGVDFFYGNVDETRLYNKALSASEILSLYESDLQRARQASSQSAASSQGAASSQSAASSSGMTPISSSTADPQSFVPSLSASGSVSDFSGISADNPFSSLPSDADSGFSSSLEGSGSDEPAVSFEISSDDEDVRPGNTTLWILVSAFAVAGAGTGSLFVYRRIKKQG